MDLKTALEVLRKELKNNKDYRIAWETNIAVQFQDACRDEGINFPQLHQLSNKAAEDFLKLLCRD